MAGLFLASLFPRPLGGSGLLGGCCSASFHWVACVFRSNWNGPLSFGFALCGREILRNRSSSALRSIGSMLMSPLLTPGSSGTISSPSVVIRL